MGYLSTIEAAIKLGYSVELIEYCTKECPKRGQDRVISTLKTDQGLLIEEKELLDFQRYLNQPWPLPMKGTRPYIPKAIQDDIKEESHYSCAICGHMDNGEVSHINCVATTLNNSPDNLIFLCPNHHTKYDYGYKVASNITIDEIEAAKKLKKMSRVRMLRYEANATKYLRAVIEFAAKLERDLKSDLSDHLREINITELRALLSSLPELSEEAIAEAHKDKDISNVDARLAEIAPSIWKTSINIGNAQTEVEVREKARSVIAKAKEVIIDIDEVECPHCDGRGQRGLAGSLCAYCKGSCFVSNAKAGAYDPDNLDEVDCPRCVGRGQTGLIGNLCTYCGGDGYVTQQEYDDYDEDDLNEVDCPHCNGKGKYGWNRTLCAYCGGSCFVSREEAAEYDRDQIDEVECPRCKGSGQTGLVGDICKLCKGATVVSEAIRDAYLTK